jgi:hypothetical protein
MQGDFTPPDVPDALLQKVVKDSKTYADILNAGSMAGIALFSQRPPTKGSPRTTGYGVFSSLVTPGQPCRSSLA